jgi:hypothetical protein
MLTSLARRALAPAALALFVLVAPARAQERTTADLDATELASGIDPNAAIDAEKLLQLWSLRLKVPITIDPQMAGTKLRFAECASPLTWGVFKEVLEFNDIVLEEKISDGGKILFAHLRRNFAPKAAPPFRVFGYGEELPKGEEIVTAVVQVRNGAGSDIFATVRGLLVRDVNRIGNILYIRGPEVVVVVDFAKNVEYYTKIIRLLDVPSPNATFRVMHVRHGDARELASQLERLFHGDPTPPLPASADKPATSVAPQLPRFVGDARTNDLLFLGAVAEVPRLESVIAELDGETSAPAREDWWRPKNLWEIAAACATLAFLGQTFILRRLQRRFALGRAHA